MRTRAKKNLLQLFPALQSRNYRFYFLGQFLSMIGTWLQQVAQGWLVLQITQSAFLVGVVAALMTLPPLFLSLFGGTVVDRVNKKQLLIVTQVASMVLALAFGLLTVFQLITIYEIGIIAVLFGVINSFDVPARQAYVNELVEKKDLHSAIALNSMIFNGARVLGPSVAGFLIFFIGTGGAFLVNAFSYTAVIVALLMIHTGEKPAIVHQNALRAMRSGLRYAYQHSVIRSLLVFTVINSIFGWSYTTILPVIAERKFHMDASGLGYMFSAAGLGAITASLLVSVYGKRVQPSTFIFGGNLLFVAAMVAFTFVSNFWVSLVFLFFGGMGLLAMFSTINTMLQHLVDPHFRGRVMSLYTMAFMGMIPFGSFEAGYLAEKFGTDVAIRVGCSVVMLAGIGLYFLRERVNLHKVTFQHAPT